jgi:hypothetical protein
LTQYKPSAAGQIQAFDLKALNIAFTAIPPVCQPSRPQGFYLPAIIHTVIHNPAVVVVSQEAGLAGTDG